MVIITIGIDLAKNVFAVHGVNVVQSVPRFTAASLHASAENTATQEIIEHHHLTSSV